jgi:hypothetical protein
VAKIGVAVIAEKKFFFNLLNNTHQKLQISVTCSKFGRNCDISYISVKIFSSQKHRYLISVLSIVPPKKRPKLDYQALAVSDIQIEILRCGIMDKTE